MATDYIKVSPFAAKKMNLDTCRATFADGNFILWEKDLSRADPDWVFHPEETIAAIGGLRLNPWEARKEQLQVTPENCRPLPVPTNPAWQDPANPKPQEPEEPEQSESNGEGARSACDTEEESPTEESPTESNGEGARSACDTDESDPEAPEAQPNSKF